MTLNTRFKIYYSLRITIQQVFESFELGSMTDPNMSGIKIVLNELLVELRKGVKMGFHMALEFPQWTTGLQGCKCTIQTRKECPRHLDNLESVTT